LCFFPLYVAWLQQLGRDTALGGEKLLPQGACWRKKMKETIAIPQAERQKKQRLSVLPQRH